jgi:regulator of replication initiation timing
MTEQLQNLFNKITKLKDELNELRQENKHLKDDLKRLKDQETYHSRWTNPQYQKTICEVWDTHDINTTDDDRALIIQDIDNRKDI